MTRRLSDRIAVVGAALGLALGLGGALGCGGRAEGPAWPARHATEKDGGESLAPRLPAAVIALEAAEDAPSSGGAEAEAGGGAGDEASAASGSAGEASAGDAEGDEGTGEEPVNTEDIVIEIDEDGD